MRPKLAVNIAGLELKNPVMVASGTFGYSDEFRDFFDVSRLGAVVTKTVTLKARVGNPGPRTCETPSGMLNAIGLENPGVDVFIKDKLPVLKECKLPIIMSIATESSAAELVELTRVLDPFPEIAAFELNISCPNVKDTPKKRLISQDAAETFAAVKDVRRSTKKTLITKLSPNVTDIGELAVAAQDAGSDAVSLINTITGMSIDVTSRKPKIGVITGGLSGPAIRPIAVRMVWEAYRKIRIPIIGMGGIMDARSALEFFIAGATAVSVGTANFVNPAACIEVIDGIEAYLSAQAISDIKLLVGRMGQ